PALARALCVVSYMCMDGARPWPEHYVWPHICVWMVPGLGQSTMCGLIYVCGWCPDLDRALCVVSYICMDGARPWPEHYVWSHICVWMVPGLGQSTMCGLIYVCGWCPALARALCVASYMCMDGARPWPEHYVWPHICV